MTVRVIETKTVLPMPWKNGGGQTCELLKWSPNSSGDWAVRISVATIDKDGSFSAFHGVDRWFAVLDGEGVKLDFASGTQTQTQQSSPLHFDGALAPFCALLKGRTRDLNLMSQRGTACMIMVEATRPFKVEADWCALYCKAAGVWRNNKGNKGASMQLQAHSLLWVEGEDANTDWTFEAHDKAELRPGLWLYYKANQTDSKKDAL